MRQSGKHKQRWKLPDALFIDIRCTKRYICVRYGTNKQPQTTDECCIGPLIWRTCQKSSVRINLGIKLLSMFAWEIWDFTAGVTRIMDSKLRKLGLLIFLFCCLVLTAVAPCIAHERRESGHHSGMGYEQAEGREEGPGGASGQIAAWLFGIANLPVVLSILLKACGTMTPQNSHFREATAQLNRQQKRYLMKLHYWLNPVAVGVAIIHFFSTKCETTAIPEIGLGIMLLICIFGIMVTFKWSPASMRKTIFRFHTSSISLLAIISILLIGHSMVD
jgi:hypothetical protein